MRGAPLAARRVEVHHEQGAPGVNEVFMTVDTADGVAFDHTVTTMATTMKALGHPGDLGVRRAHAVGLLADPQKALDLLAVADVADPDGTVDPDNDPAVCVAEAAVYATPSPFRRPTLPDADTDGRPDRSGEVVMVVHITDADLLAGPTVDTRGVARTDLGPVLMGRLRDWLLTAGTATIKPVLDVTTMDAVEQHDPPARMADAVRLRDETCVFPGCSRRSDSSDLDHITDYIPMDEGGPPGQTHPDNLAPLCRRHHRAKTFGAFTYHRLPDGSYQWALPSGRRIPPTHSGHDPDPDRSAARHHPVSGPPARPDLGIALRGSTRDDRPGGPAMKVRPGAVIRGVGVAAAYLAPATPMRSGILFVAYAGGWLVNKPGLQVFMVVPDTEEPWKRASVPFATAVSSWSAVMLAATTALRRTRLPGPIGAVVLGGAFVAVDSVLADLGEKRDAAKVVEPADAPNPPLGTATEG